jgi:hypothetical protein
MAVTLFKPVAPDAEGFVPNGWVNSYPHNDFEYSCYLQCCVPEAYARPDIWYCEAYDCSGGVNGYRAQLRQPGECINCTPPR